MTVSNEIQRIKQNIASVYTVAEEKGATLPETKNLNNLPDTIRSISTGGSSEGVDKVWAINTTDRELVKGDRVLLQLDGHGDVISQTLQDTSGASYPPLTSISKNGQVCGTGGKMYVWNQDNREFVVSPADSTSLEQNYCFVDETKYVCTDWGTRTAGVGFFGNVRPTFNTNPIELSKDFSLDNTTATLYKKGVEEGFVIPSYSKDNYTSTLRGFRFYGNNLYILYGNKPCYLKKIDLSDFPNCTCKDFTLPTIDGYGIGRIAAFWGDNEVEYVTINNETSLVILRYNEEIDDFESFDVYTKLSKTYAYMNPFTGILSFSDANLTPYIFVFDENKFNLIDINVNLSFLLPTYITYGMNVTTNSNVNTICVAVYYSKSSSSSNPIQLILIKRLPTEMYITSVDKNNYTSLTSVTGVITGNKTSDNRYEVETILPDMVNVTLNVTPDVNLDTELVINRTK